MPNLPKSSKGKISENTDSWLIRFLLLISIGCTFGILVGVFLSNLNIFSGKINNLLFLNLPSIVAVVGILLFLVLPLLTYLVKAIWQSSQDLYRKFSFYRNSIRRDHVVVVKPTLQEKTISIVSILPFRKYIQKLLRLRRNLRNRKNAQHIVKLTETEKMFEMARLAYEIGTLTGLESPSSTTIKGPSDASKDKDYQEYFDIVDEFNSISSVK